MLPPGVLCEPQLQEEAKAPVVQAQYPTAHFPGLGLSVPRTFEEFVASGSPEAC